MKYGMPTLIELGTIRAHAELARKLSLDFIEINMSFPEYTPSAIDIGELRAIAREYGVFYTIHADEYLNPFDFEYEVSECYFSVMKRTLEVARQIGARVVNLHLQKGIYITLPDKVVLLTDIRREQYLRRVREFIALCERTLEGTDIIIAIENVDTNPFSKSQLEALEYFMASDRFALTLDTGHEMKLGFADTPVFLAYPEKVRHMHLHDYKDGKPHLALGEGEVDIDGRLTMVRGDTCLVEVKTVSGLLTSVDYLNQSRNFNTGKR